MRRGRKEGGKGKGVRKGERKESVSQQDLLQEVESHVYIANFEIDDLTVAALAPPIMICWEFEIVQ